MQRSRAMRHIKELIMIIPVILNLKGNLEMNLSARLGTAAHMGELDKLETRNAIVLGNLALLQVQAAVVSFVAACVSLLLGLVIPESELQPGSSAASNVTSVPSHARAPIRRPSLEGASERAGFAEYVVSGYSLCAPHCAPRLQDGNGGFLCHDFYLSGCRSAQLFHVWPCHLMPQVRSRPRYASPFISSQWLLHLAMRTECTYRMLFGCP